MAEWYGDSKGYTQNPQGSPGDGTAKLVWAATQNYAVGDRVVRLTGDAGLVYECTTDGGSSGGSEPTWDTDPVTPGTTVDDGITWTTRAPTTWANAHDDAMFVGPLMAGGDSMFLRHGTANTGQVYTMSHLNTKYIELAGNAAATDPSRIYACNDNTSAEPPQEADMLAQGTYGIVEVTGSSNQDTGVHARAGYTRGMEFHSPDSLAVNIISAAVWHMVENCKSRSPDSGFIGHGAGTSSVANGRNFFLNTVHVKDTTGNRILCGNREGTHDWNGGSIEANASAAIGNLVFSLYGGSGEVRWNGLDLSGQDPASPVDLMSDVTVKRFMATNCRFHENVNLLPATVKIGAEVVFSGCQTDSSGVNAPSVQFAMKTFWGELNSSTTYYLNASDGTTPYSMKVTPVGDGQCIPGAIGMRTLPMAVRVSASDTLISVSVMRWNAGGQPALLNKTNCWLEVSSPDNDTTAYAVLVDKEMEHETSPTTWATNADSWSGSPSNPRTQTISVAISPDHDDQCSVVLCYTDDGEDLYVDYPVAS